MTRITLTLTLLSLMSLGCNDAKFVNPIVRPESAPVCDELFGAYKHVEPGRSTVSYLHIGSAGDQFPRGFMRVAMVNHRPDKKRELGSLTMVAFAQPVGDYFVGNLPMPDEKNMDSQLHVLENRWDQDKVGGYYFFLLRKTQDGLELRYLNSAEIDKRIESGTLAGTLGLGMDDPEDEPTEEEPQTTVTATTQELKELFSEESLDELFASEIVHYKELD